MGSQDYSESERTGNAKLGMGSGSQIPAVGSEVRVRHSSWDQRSGNWDMSSDVIGRSASDVLGRSSSLTQVSSPSRRENH
jgi:palmitoyltransferase ZDHHC9/14/18